MRAHAGRTAWRPCAHQWRLGPINCEALGKQHMGDTYNSAAEAETDRAQQKAVLAPLNAWDRALRRDECGAWCIRGERGSIHTWGDAAIPDSIGADRICYASATRIAFLTVS